MNDEHRNEPEMLNDAPGMPCPECGFRIRIGMRDLLRSRYINCPKCLLQLEVDREKSARSLELLQSLSVALDNIEELKHQKPG
jgi:DNA-directed RNA polymerase subunit RPC12/RpoP